MKHRIVYVLEIAVLFCGVALAQSTAVANDSKAVGTSDAGRHGTADPVKQSSERQLARVQVISVSSEDVGLIYEPIRCDRDRNIYFEADADGISGIRKLAPNGERLALFQPGANPDFKKIDSTNYFSVADSGELYELVFPHELTRYVFEYRPDGSYKRAIKLEPGFPWMPSSFAVFPSGNLLVSGLEYDRDQTSVMWPFTGIFSSDGALLKEIQLEDDERLRNLAAVGDSRVSSARSPRANLAIDFSKMEIGNDGNVYLMRWINPAIFYAISAGGEVVRRFTTDPGDPSYKPVSMHVSANRIAVLYFRPDTKTILAQVVDLEGHELAKYTEASAKNSDLLGSAFACYQVNPERFTFLVSDDNNKLQVQLAEPK